jgi:hypothetical protein
MLHRALGGLCSLHVGWGLCERNSGLMENAGAAGVAHVHHTFKFCP